MYNTNIVLFINYNLKLLASLIIVFAISVDFPGVPQRLKTQWKHLHF